MARTPTRPWDAVDYLGTEEDMIAYIDAALDDGAPPLVAAALGDVARAKGMSRVAAGAGLGGRASTRPCSRGGNLEFATVVKVMRALGLRLRAARI